MRLLDYPFSIGINVTNECNLRCLHCSQSSGLKSKNELDTNEIYNIIDDAIKNHAGLIMFSGGEPLMRKEFFELAEYANAHGIRTIVTTNGTLITKEIARRHLVNFSSVRISLDSACEEGHDYLRNMPGTFNKAIEAFQILKDLDISRSMVTTVSKLNFHEIEDIWKIAERFTLRDWSLSFFSPTGRGSDIANQMLEPNQVKNVLQQLLELKKKSTVEIEIDVPYSVLLDNNNMKRDVNTESFCAAATTNIAIFSDGNVGPCFDMAVYGGNIRQKSIYDIWHNSLVFNQFRDKSAIKGKCKGCEYLLSCGGCRAMAYMATGDYLGDDPLCWKS